MVKILVLILILLAGPAASADDKASRYPCNGKTIWTRKQPTLKHEAFQSLSSEEQKKYLVQKAREERLSQRNLRTEGKASKIVPKQTGRKSKSVHK